MKQLLVVLASLLAAAAPASAQKQVQVDVQKKLNLKIRALSFDETTIGDAIDFVRDVSGLDIAVDWRGANKAGVHKGTTISLHVKNITVSRSLKLILISAAGPGKLDYVIRGKKVLISTPEALKKLPPLPEPATRPATVPVQATRPSTADRVTLRKLVANVATFEFDQAELQDVLQYLRKTTGVRIYLNWRAAKSVGVDRSTKISVKLKKAKASAALRAALTAAAKPGELTYAVGEGLILISTPKDLKKLLPLARARPAAETDIDRALAATLEKKVAKLEFKEVELADALQFLREVTGTNMYISPAGLKAAGAKMSAPVSLRVTDLPARLALVLCLTEAADTDSLGYAAADGVLLISTPDGAKALAALINSRPPTAKTKQNLRALKILSERMPTLNFVDIELKDVIQFFRGTTGLNIFMDWRSLRPAGLKGSSPVSFHLKGGAFRTALHLTLADAAGQIASPAGFIIEDGMVYISTLEGLKKLRAGPGQPASP